MTTQNTRRALTGGTLAVLAVLFVAVIALANNLLRGAQVDLTQNKLYTLSEGTEKVLGEIDEPINLYYFFSDKGTAEIIIAKQRNGPIGMVRLAFIGAYTRFENLASGGG